MQIIPAVLAKSKIKFDIFEQKAFIVSDIIQIDICDGKYVNTLTWPLTEKISESDDLFLPHWEEAEYSADIMCKQPSLIFDMCVRFGFYEVIFHYRSLKEEWARDFSGEKFSFYLDKLFAKSENFEMRTAIAFHINDDFEELISNLDSYKEKVSYVQVMGIATIGQQGNVFLSEIFDIIKKLKNKGFLVCVDGGVNEENIKQIQDAGADAVVVGSALDLEGDHFLEKYNVLINIVNS